MEVAINAALSVVGKALGPGTDGLLESWAASTTLGLNIDALKMELLYAQAMLENAQGKDLRSPALKKLLHKLRKLAYGAEDVLDELDYFRIQDDLEGTNHAADIAAQGCVGGLVLNARHTARATASKLKLLSCSHGAIHDDPDDQEDGGKRGCLSSVRPCGGREISSSPQSPTKQGVVQEADGGCMPKVASSAHSAAHTIGKHFPCYSFPSVQDDDARSVMLGSSNMIGSARRFLCGTWPSNARQRNHAAQAQKLKFDRVEMSTKMVELVELLKPLCARVKELLGSAIVELDLLDSNRTSIQDATTNRQKTTPKIIEPELYGRDDQKRNIIAAITHDEYCANELTILPLVGPGGIGKTTLTQHVYKEVESSFQVSIWICVSLDFNANRLTQEMVKKIPKVKDEKENASEEELIEQRLKSKRLLLVLDDMWTYKENEWKKLLAPLRYKGGEKGNVVIVTTRKPEVANMVRTTNSSIYDVERLNPKDIMSFFEVCVFGDQVPWKNHPELRDVGSEIVNKLKGFPLAAKTVGRLLRNKLTLGHWTRVVESREWELETEPNDIMPALKLSYDYLSFHLQQCFSYCALFPEDYRYGSKQLVHLWMGLGILHSCDQNKRTEDVGLRYLDDLVNHGFFKKIEKEDGPYYVMHDLLHELAVKVSSYECVSINSSNARSIPIPPSIRHLSIIIDNSDVGDKRTFEDCRNNFTALGKRLKVENIRTLMLFGEYHGSFVKTFKDLLREARALRAIFLSGASYSVEDMLLNFSEFVHLRYLCIKSVSNKDMCLPSALFRSYHLEVLDLEEWGGSFGSTSQMSNLVNLRHFVVPEKKLKLHSDISEVGKLKFLEELRSFEVGKEPQGFELSQLRELTKLGGSLGLYNLEKVQEKDEGKEVKLLLKNHFQKLILEWDNKDAPLQENVLEILVPHKNLQDLCIRGHGGANCPSWLGGNLSVKNLETLCLYDVSWNTLPPFGDMSFIDVRGENFQSHVSSQSFQILKRLELVKIPRLTKWVENDTCTFFSFLEVLIIEYCPELIELPFSHPTSSHAKQQNMSWFRNLRELKIVYCPKLTSLPLIPWTAPPSSAESHPTSSHAKQQIMPWFCNLLPPILWTAAPSSVESHPTSSHAKQQNMSWFPNLRVLKIVDCPKLTSLPPIPWTAAPCSAEIARVGSDFEELVYSKNYRSELSLSIKGKDGQDTMFWSVLDFHNLADLKEFVMENCPPLPLIHLQKLKSLKTLKITRMRVVLLLSEGESRDIECVLPVERIEINDCANGKELTQLLSHFPKLPELTIDRCKEITRLGVVEHQTTATTTIASSPSSSADKMEQYARGEEELAAAAGGLLLLPSQLQELRVHYCGELRLLSDSLENSNAGGGLQSLCSLRKLDIWFCPKFLSSYSSSASSSSPFPTSLQDLRLAGQEGMETLAPLSNLISLTDLSVYKCGDLRGEGIWPLVGQGRLTTLEIRGAPKFFTGSEPPNSGPHVEERGSYSSKLERLTTDDPGVLTPPICSFLSSSLTTLVIRWSEEVERFTEDQEEALHLLTSLQDLWFIWCEKLQRLPAGLTKLTNLKSIHTYACSAIRSLPKDGLPSSLLELSVQGLPSEELKRQCRKLKGTIPIIREYDTDDD